MDRLWQPIPSATMVATGTPHLSEGDKEDLADLRLLMSAAEGNLRAATLGDDLLQALDNAEEQLDQALRNVRRIQSHLGQRKPPTADQVP